MRRLIVVCLLLSVATWAGCAQTGGKMGHKKHEAGHEGSKSMLRHVVLFKFKDGTSPEQIKQVEQAFAALPSKIKEVARFEWGTDVSPEKKSQGITHCFLLTFRSEADRDAYLVHPAHKEFGSLVGPYLDKDKLCVVDYWAKH
jgi:hypothetical protein